MGIERSYQAIPASSNLIDLAKSDIEFGELLCLTRYHFLRGLEPYRGPSSPVGRKLEQRVKDLIVADPSLADRNVDLDKRWDQIHYLLSARYRGEAPTPDDVWFDMGVEGEEAIAEHVRGSQGCPLRYTSPAQVPAVAAALTSLNIEQSKSHYDLSAMQARGVYKALAGRENDDDWAFLKELMSRLRHFYIEAAICGDGVLVITE